MCTAADLKTVQVHIGQQIAPMRAVVEGLDFASEIYDPERL
jgi:hypothetical protein